MADVLSRHALRVKLPPIMGLDGIQPLWCREPTSPLVAPGEPFGLEKRGEPGTAGKPGVR